MGYFTAFFRVWASLQDMQNGKGDVAGLADRYQVIS
jgi:hypothetical protein